MTIKEAILKSLSDLQKPSNHKDILKNILQNKYYDFKTAKTPGATISALLGDFIRKNDTRVKRNKTKNGTYFYYLSRMEQNISIDDFYEFTDKGLKKEPETKKIYQERDLHKLLSSYLKNKNTYAKTILHEESKNSRDNHQKWIHPDMIGIEFINLTSKVNKAFMKILNKADTFKLSSYEIKKEINTDYELKKCYFQAIVKLDKSNIHVAQYLTVLPEKKLLEAKLHQAIQKAKERYNNKEVKDEILN